MHATPSNSYYVCLFRFSMRRGVCHLGQLVSEQKRGVEAMEQGGERERGEEKKKSIRVIKEGNGDTFSFHRV